MYWNNRTASLCFNILFLALCSWGLFLNTGLSQGTFNFGVLVYYTILSNLFCLFYYIATLTTPLVRLKGAVVFTITVTMLIYHFLLVPTTFSMDNDNHNLFSIGNLLVHYIVPTLVIIDWLVFSPKGRFGVYDPLLWLLIPAGYFIFILIRAHFFGVIPGTGSRFPYPFIDVDALGWTQLGENLAGIALFFVILGYIIWGIDRLMYRLK